MALYIAHSIFHLTRLLYVRPESLDPATWVPCRNTAGVRVSGALLEVLKVINGRTEAQLLTAAVRSHWNVCVGQRQLIKDSTESSVRHSRLIPTGEQITLRKGEIRWLAMQITILVS